MIGWINLSVEAFICDSFGRDAWLKIIEQAHVDCNWVSSCPYPDKVTYDLVITGAGILGVTVPQALEAYGAYFVNYVIKQGYLRLLQSLGSNIAEFLANLNNLHLHLTMGFPSMVAPAFRVEEVTGTSLLLHYHSVRPALWPIVVGVLKGASQKLFGHDVELELVRSREAGDCDHEVFRVTYPHQESLSHWDDHGAALASTYAMPRDFFFEMFPFHLLLAQDCSVLQAGAVLRRLFSSLTPGSAVSDTFKLRHPFIPFEWDRILLEADTLFLLKALESGLELKGQMVKTQMPDGTPALLFLGSPRLANLEEMNGHGLYLSDIPLHDMSRDFVLLAEQRQAEADLKERFEKMAVELRQANERLELTTRWLDEEKHRSDALLYRMLPADIAADLREGHKVEPISYGEVTILFSDMVGFTNTSAKSTPEEVYVMLNEMYDKFDDVVDDFPDIYKLETIGDAYFLVCNLTTECDKHVDVVIDFAIRMQDAARQVKNAQGEPVQIRIGIHTGPVVGGVLGAKTPRFSIYGDTVNVASRMESHGLPGKIHISGASYARIVDKHKYRVRERGNIAVKGRGNMTTYLIGGVEDDWLLRHSSFDSQLDAPYRHSVSSTSLSVSGTSGGQREGSFVITGSGKSVENIGGIGSNRVMAMEAITEAATEEGERHSRPLVSGADNIASSASINANVLLVTGDHTNIANSFLSTAPAPRSAAEDPARYQRYPSSGFGGGSGGQPVRASPSRRGTGTATGSILAAGDSFREGKPPVARDASYGQLSNSGLGAREGSFGTGGASGAQPSGRETSFRAVYARSGRTGGGPNSPQVAANSRSQAASPLVGGAAGGAGSLLAAGNASTGSAGSSSNVQQLVGAVSAPVEPSAAEGGVVESGGSASGNGMRVNASDAFRVEASGSSGLVLARQKSPLGPGGVGLVSAASGSLRVQAAPASAPVSAAALDAAPTAAPAAMPAAASPTNSLSPAQAAILEQLKTTSLEPKRSGAGLELPSGGSAVLSTTSSSSGAVAAAAIGAVGGLESPATSSSKSKGITSKLKSLFKKDK
ncbi:hypothetical protein CHLRE_16g649050v5 [Chlamydomonas reinhardtii]|uniref:guanylate cyclase n=1 Tax=Chlamydomonas reinhardtii TaxID=3055 RepID=A0A2K3CSQ5_CHLRE|nr:uncharacterized protein CHLRE_16g649050v5 [Chlamydomonas reinhardtii]PNW71315.1 hypothetical protein CHLRE_16g649050v5 [Chlamydomonas reinhardtii]